MQSGAKQNKKKKKRAPSAKCGQTDQTWRYASSTYPSARPPPPPSHCFHERPACRVQSESPSRAFARRKGQSWRDITGAPSPRKSQFMRVWKLVPSLVCGIESLVDRTSAPPFGLPGVRGGRKKSGRSGEGVRSEKLQRTCRALGRVRQAEPPPPAARPVDRTKGRTTKALPSIEPSEPGASRGAHVLVSTDA